RIIHSIGLFNILNADAICAYGIYRWGLLTIYYDTYAHLDLDEKFHINNKTFHDIKKGLFTRYNRGDQPIKVKSCFSGFTLYRTSSIISAVYDMTPKNEKNLECEHVRLHKKLENVFMNPSMINLVLLND
ncbi:MAG: hypothetical protein ACOCT9_01905, partial [archaeon]